MNRSLLTKIFISSAIAVTMIIQNVRNAEDVIHVSINGDETLLYLLPASAGIEFWPGSTTGSSWDFSSYGYSGLPYRLAWEKYDDPSENRFPRRIAGYFFFHKVQGPAGWVWAMGVPYWIFAVIILLILWLPFRHR